MARLSLEKAWVEFPVRLARGHNALLSRTGGVIDSERGVITALRDISFDLKEGDRLGLMGHNGAGKSTMLRLLAGAYPPSRGRRISVGSISTLFSATPGLNIDGTGRENLITCGLHLGMSWRQIKMKMDEIVDFAELGDYIDLPVRIYSSGMVTRLGFSIATAVEPEILLLDEGLATGDAQFAQKAEAKLKALMECASILVIASHSDTLLANVCSRCLLLEHGQAVAEGPARTVIGSYRNTIIELARTGDQSGLQRAYKMANDMVNRGEMPPPELEEQGLRYALTLAPNDFAMLRRFVQLLKEQGKSVPSEVEMRLILVTLTHHPEQVNLKDRLKKILESSAHEIPEHMKLSARNMLEAD